MQRTTEKPTATSSDERDESTLRLGDKTIYAKSLRRLKHYQQLEDEVIDAYLTIICIQSQGIKSSFIPSLYAQYFINDELNYISNQRIIAQLSRTNLLDSNMVFLPIGRNGHWCSFSLSLNERGEFGIISMVICLGFSSHPRFLTFSASFF